MQYTPVLQNSTRRRISIVRKECIWYETSIERYLRTTRYSGTLAKDRYSPYSLYSPEPLSVHYKSRSNRTLPDIYIYYPCLCCGESQPYLNDSYSRMLTPTTADLLEAGKYRTKIFQGI